jgi:hypothetical protein
MDYRRLGWKKGTSWSGKGPTSQDWHKGGILIHDNGWGTIQIQIGNDDGVPRYNNSTMFASVGYFSGHRGTIQGEMSQLTAEQAFDVAVAMANGLIESGVDYRKAIDLNPQRNSPNST